MVSHTRRRLLQVATAAAGGLAGCGGLTGDAVQSSRSSSASDGTNAPEGNTVTDPPTVLLRGESERPLIRLGDADEEDPEPFHSDRSPRLTNELVAAESKGRQLTAADDGDRERVSSFVSATDFDSETLYLESKWVRECFRLQFCSISWEPSTVRTHYVRTLRPYDERCAADAHVVESRLIRLPAALEEASVSGYGSSTSGSGQCGGPRARTRESTAAGNSSETAFRASDGGER